MSKADRPVLRAPLKQLLDDELPEARVQRMWRVLANPPAAPARAFTLRSQLWAAVAVLLLSIGTGSWLYVRSRPAALAIRGTDTLAPQRTLGGTSHASYRLTDGSVIRLDAAARVEVLKNDAHAFEVRLEAGRARFDVKPGGARRWRVDCGELSVEVVGTSFIVDRTAEGVGVRVQHGVVRVRGARVPGGLRRLTTGERVYVAAGPKREQTDRLGVPASSRPSTGENTAPPPPQPLAAANAAPRQLQAAELGAKPARETARQRTQPAAARQPRLVAPARGVGRQPAAAELAQLLRAADRARRDDRAAEAERILEQVRATAPESAHAALAALTLARLRLASAPSLAASDLEAALAGQLPAALREDARARLVEAHARAGDAARARSAAEAYGREFPQGRRIADVERWIRLP